MRPLLRGVIWRAHGGDAGRRRRHRLAWLSRGNACNPGNGALSRPSSSVELSSLPAHAAHSKFEHAALALYHRDWIAACSVRLALFAGGRSVGARDGMWWQAAGEGTCACSACWQQDSSLLSCRPRAARAPAQQSTDHKPCAQSSVQGSGAPGTVIHTCAAGFLMLVSCHFKRHLKKEGSLGF